MKLFQGIGKGFQIFSGVFMILSTLYMVFGNSFQTSSKEKINKEVLREELVLLEGQYKKYVEYQKRGWVSPKTTNELRRVMEAHMRLLQELP